MKITALLLSALVLSAYFYVIFIFSKEIVNVVREVKNKFLRIAYAIASLVPGLSLFFLLRKEKTIYYWDFSGYWIRAVIYTNDFFNSPLDVLERVYLSIQHDEYNILPNVLLSPANKLIGPNFNEYVFSIYIIYCLPFALVLSSVIIKMHPHINNWLKLLIPFFILCFTPFLIPVRFGFIDIVGLVYIALILSVLIRSNYFRELKIKNAVITGILLLLIIFNRRWYAFWFVAFYFSVFILNTFVALRNKDKKIFISTCINLGIAGIIPLVIMLIFFYSYFEMTVLKDYKDIYSAYRSASASIQFDKFIDFYGWFIVLTALAGICLSVKKYKSSIVFFTVSIVIIIALFIRVNDFGGMQHFYLLLPFFLFFFLRTVIYFHDKKYMVISIFILLMINNIFVFGFNTPGSSKFIFAAVEAKRVDRTDYDVIDKMADRIIDLQQSGSIVYCFASSFAFNEDIIKSIKLPDYNNPIFKMPRTQHVDKRDYFPNDFFLAKYIITTNPTQLHLTADNQKLVAYFNESIMNGELKKHYVIDEEYQLQNNIKAFLMKKVSTPNPYEIQKIYDYFKNAYPEYKGMYAVNHTLAKSSEIIVGNGYGTVFSEGENQVHLYPGTTRPSEISIIPDKNDSTLSFTATFNNKENLTASCNATRDGEVFLVIKQDDITSDSIYITHKQDKDITLNLKGKKKITLTVNKGKNEDYCDWFKLTNFIIK